jgi:hypothetical protein
MILPSCLLSHDSAVEHLKGSWCKVAETAVVFRGSANWQHTQASDVCVLLL